MGNGEMSVCGWMFWALHLGLGLFCLSQCAHGPAACIYVCVCVYGSSRWCLSHQSCYPSCMLYHQHTVLFPMQARATV